jgi:hypothetical protein
MDGCGVLGGQGWWRGGARDDACFSLLFPSCKGHTGCRTVISITCTIALHSAIVLKKKSDATTQPPPKHPSTTT